MTEFKPGDKLAIRTSKLVGHDYEYVSKTLIRHSDGRSYLGRLVRYPNSDDFVAYTTDEFNRALKPWSEPPTPYPFKLGDRIKLKDSEISSNCPVYTVMEIKDDGNVKLAFVGLAGAVREAKVIAKYADSWELVNDGDS